MIEVIMVAKIAAVITLVSFGVSLLIVASRILTADDNEYSLNRERTGSLIQSLTGRVNTVRDGVRDYRVGAGLAVNTTTGKWEEQGMLSDEALDSILKR